MRAMAGTEQLRNHRDLQELWHGRLLAARRRYDDAVAMYQAAAAETQNGGRPAALNSALTAEKKARDEYMRMLQIFSNLMLHGDVPEE